MNLFSDLTLSTSPPCLHNRSPIGESATDFHMADLVQEITYLSGFRSYVENESPCLHNGSPIGISGIDFHMADIVLEITYYILFVWFQVLR